MMQLVHGGQIIATRMEEGRLSEVIASLRQLEGSALVLPAWLAMLGDAVAQAGQHDEAAALLARLVDEDPSGFLDDVAAQVAVRHLSETCRQLGDVTRAAALLPYVELWAGQLLITLLGFTIDGAGDRCIGHLLATVGRLDDADAAYTTRQRSNDRSSSHRSSPAPILACSPTRRTWRPR